MKGETIGGRYELEAVAGSGGMSTVWRARDRLLDRNVALKVLHSAYGEDDEYVERFRHEALAVAQLSHPNIVTVIDRGEDRGRQFIVFEYVDGENLKEFAEHSGPLPVDQVVGLALPVARALAFAHERGIVHRDVKPQNVLLNGDRPKVTDFGIARSLDVDRGVTQPGTVLGSSNYIAPEQASGEPVDAKSDVYSLGCVLFELLTGDVPFPGENFVAVALQHLNEQPPPVLERRRDAHPRLAALVDAMLAKDRAARPTMSDVVSELEALGDPAQATVALPRVRVRRRGRSPWPLVLALLGLLLLGAAIVGALSVSGDRDGGAGADAAPRITARAVRAVDPKRDGEHDGEVPFATDGDRATYWTTSSYDFPNGGFGKPGVGLLVRTSRPPDAIVIRTETPGFHAVLRTLDGTVASSPVVATPTTVVGVVPDVSSVEEFVIWITNRGPHRAVRINEVSAR